MWILNFSVSLLNGDSGTHHLLVHFQMKHPLFCFTRFEPVCLLQRLLTGPLKTKFCPLANKPVAVGFRWDDRFLTKVNTLSSRLVQLGPAFTSCLQVHVNVKMYFTEWWRTPTSSRKANKPSLATDAVNEITKQECYRLMLVLCRYNKYTRCIWSGIIHFSHHSMKLEFWSGSKNLLTHWLLELFAKKWVFWTFRCFLSWILAKLALIRLKMRLQHNSLPFLSPASHSTTLRLGHAQKSKFWDSFWTRKWPTSLGFSIFFLPSFFLLFFSVCCSDCNDLLLGLLVVKKLLRKRHQDEQILAWSSQV